MAIAQEITYDDKLGLTPKKTRINQVWDTDMNDLKTVINANKNILNRINGVDANGAVDGEIIIGHGVTGNGADTTTIGGATNTDTFLKGGTTVKGTVPGQDILNVLDDAGNIALKIDGDLKIGIGAVPDTQTYPARIKINALNNKFFSLSYPQVEEPTVLNDMDVYYAYGNIWLNREIATLAYKGYKFNRCKLSGTDADVLGSTNNNIFNIERAIDFNKYHNNPNEYGNSTLLHTGYTYANKLLDQYQGLGGDASTGLNIEPNIDPRMYDAMMLSVTGFNTTMQLFVDVKGSIYTRALGQGAFGVETDYKKALTDNSNKTTTLGGDTDEPSSKFDVISTTKGTRPFSQMTEAQRLAIATPAVGLHAYQTDGVEGAYVNHSTKGWSYNGPISFSDREIPTGVKDGVNTVFTLAEVPSIGSEHVYLNGLLQTLTSDYTIAGGVVTFVSAPISTDELVISSRY